MAGEDEDKEIQRILIDQFIMNCPEDDLLAGSDSDFCEKKRKKSTYIRKNPLPRILKRDLRRDFGMMFINISNGCDCSVLSKFLSEFCLPTIRYYEYNAGAAIHWNKPPIRAANHLNSVFEILSHYAVNIPDYCLQMEKCTIVQREGWKGSKLVLMGKFKGTFFLPMFMENDPCEKRLKESKCGIKTFSNQVVIQQEVAFGGKEEIFPSTFIQPSPSSQSEMNIPPLHGACMLVSCITKPQFTFYFNEQLQVIRIDNICTIDANAFRLADPV